MISTRQRSLRRPAGWFGVGPRGCPLVTAHPDLKKVLCLSIRQWDAERSSMMSGWHRGIGTPGYEIGRTAVDAVSSPRRGAGDRLLRGAVTVSPGWPDKAERRRRRPTRPPAASSSASTRLTFFLTSMANLSRGASGPGKRATPESKAPGSGPPPAPSGGPCAWCARESSRSLSRGRARALGPDGRRPKVEDPGCFDRPHLDDPHQHSNHDNAQ